jgi:diamine N-acetyltransferase
MPDYDIDEITDLDADFEDLLAMVIELHDYHMEYGFPPLKPDFAESYRKYLDSTPDRLLLMARFQDDAIGYMATFVNRSPSTDERTGFIGDAYVRPVARRFGVGQAMLDRSEAWCRERGLSTLRLNVLAVNEIGLSFWTKTGFEPFTYTVTKKLAPS